MDLRAVLLCAVFPACLVMACRKEPPTSDGEPIEVVISCDSGNTGGSAMTKGVPDYWENSITDLQVMVFSPRDSSIIEYRAVSGSSLSMALCAGWEYIIYAVANSANDLSDVTSIADLRSRTVRMDNQKKNHLEMIGETGVMMVDPSRRIVIKMERIVAKVEIKRMWVYPECDECCMRSFDLDWACLATVPTLCDYGFKPVPSSWIMSGIVTDDDMDVPFYRIEDESYTQGLWNYSTQSSVVMYSLPDVSGKLSLARYVAVKGFGIGVDGKDCWHCVRFRIPSLSHNKRYVIDMLHLRNVVRNDVDINIFTSLETRSALDGLKVEYYEADADYDLEVSDMTTGEILERYEAHY